MNVLHKKAIDFEVDVEGLLVMKRLTFILFFSQEVALYLSKKGLENPSILVGWECHKP